MRRYLLLIALFVLVALPHQHVYAIEPRLERLEAFLRDDVPQRLLLEAKRDTSHGQLQQRQAESGWQIFGNFGFERQRQDVSPVGASSTPISGNLANGTAFSGSVQNPAQNGGSQTTNGTPASIGVSYPLLGKQARLQQEVANTRLIHRSDEAQLAAYRREQLRRVRLAWLNIWLAQEKTRIALAVLAEEVRANSVLSARAKNRLVLDSDRQEALTLFASMRRLHAEAARQAAQSRVQLSQLSHMVIPPNVPRPHVTQSTRADELTDPLTILQAATEDFADIRAASSATNGIDSALQLSYNRSLQSAGTSQYDNSVLLSVNFNFPIALGGWRDGRAAELRAKVSEQEQLVLAEVQRREERQVELIGEIARAQANVALQNQRWQAAQQLLREKNARYRVLTGDIYEQWFSAFTRTYAVELDVVLAWEALQELHVELASLNGKRLDPVDDTSDDMRTTVSTPNIPNIPSAPKAVATEHHAVMTERTASIAPTQGVYVWEAAALFNDPQNAVRQLQARRILRVLISLNAQEIRQLGVTRRALARLLSILHQQSIGVELLLAEPRWMYAEQRPRLIALVRSLQDLDFDALHLDLEVEQLPQPTKALPWWLQTIKAVVNVARVPVGISMHPRYLDDPELMQALGATGIKNLALMSYRSEANSQIAVLEKARRYFPRLDISLALSLESSLPPENSYATRPTDLFKDFATLAQTLNPAPSLLIQSWEDFLKIQP